MDFRAAAEPVITFLRERGEPIAVIGGMAMHVYGFPRATYDLDFVVNLESQPSLVAFMEGRGYETLHRSNSFSGHRHSDQTLGRVDFMYVRGDTSEQIFLHAAEVEIFTGIQVAVAAPEHIIAMKVHSIAEDPERMPRDLGDIRHLLAQPNLDLEAVAHAFERRGLRHLYERLRETP